MVRRHVSPRWRLPTLATLNAPLQETDPVGRIRSVERYPPTLRHDGSLAEPLRASLSASPPLLRGRIHRIERWDYFSALQRQTDYSSEPPSSTDKRISPHPALPAKRKAEG